MNLQYQLGNGSWVNCNDRTDEFIGRAIGRRMRVNGGWSDPIATVAEATAILDSGAEISIGSDWYANIRCAAAHESKMAARRAEQISVQMVQCDCGHTVAKSAVMSASLGTACPDCYDRMS